MIRRCFGALAALAVALCIGIGLTAVRPNVAAASSARSSPRYIAAPAVPLVMVKAVALEAVSFRLTSEVSVDVAMNLASRSSHSTIAYNLEPASAMTRVAVHGSSHDGSPRVSTSCAALLCLTGRPLSSAWRFTLAKRSTS